MQQAAAAPQEGESESTPEWALAMPYQISLALPVSGDWTVSHTFGTVTNISRELTSIQNLKSLPILQTRPEHTL